VNLLCRYNVPGCRCWPGWLKMVRYRLHGVVHGFPQHPVLALKELGRLLQ